jgi:hypothetical protein
MLHASPRPTQLPLVPVVPVELIDVLVVFVVLVVLVLVALVLVEFVLVLEPLDVIGKLHIGTASEHAS